jgi:hypothetical protein
MAARKTTKSAGKARRKSPNRRSRAKSGSARKRTSRWSHRVTKESDALDREQGVFKLNSPKKIAASLKRSAERSRRRKADPYRSAMSMLTFYINRGGRNLSARRKQILEKAKDELRERFGKPVQV